jgi:hypothetical protein
MNSLQTRKGRHQTQLYFAQQQKNGVDAAENLRNNKTQGVLKRKEYQRKNEASKNIHSTRFYSVLDVYQQSILTNSTI